MISAHKYLLSGTSFKERTWKSGNLGHVYSNPAQSCWKPAFVPANWYEEEGQGTFCLFPFLFAFFSPYPPLNLCYLLSPLFSLKIKQWRCLQVYPVQFLLIMDVQTTAVFLKRDLVTKASAPPHVFAHVGLFAQTGSKGSDMLLGPRACQAYLKWNKPEVLARQEFGT